MRPVRGRAGDAIAEAEALPAEPEGAEPGRVDLRELLDVHDRPGRGEGLRRRDQRPPGRRRPARVGAHRRRDAATSTPGSALDRDAAERALSVYVPGAVEPMLPERLSNGLCSLVPVARPPLRHGRGAVRRRPRARRARLLPQRDPQRRAAHLLARGGDPDRSRAGRGEASPRRSRSPSSVASELRRRRYRRGALRIETGEIAFAFDGRGRGRAGLGRGASRWRTRSSRS